MKPPPNADRGVQKRTGVLKSSSDLKSQKHGVVGGFVPQSSSKQFGRRGRRRNSSTAANEGLDPHWNKCVSVYSIINQNDDSNADELLRGISTGKITLNLSPPSQTPQSAVRREEGYGDHCGSLEFNGKIYIKWSFKIVRSLISAITDD